jgi:hypothetical protein
MVTDGTRQAAMTASNEGFLGKVGSQLRQWICGLHGHDELLHFEQGRMSLQCVSCGYQSPGWDVKRAAGRADTSAPSAPRARVLRLPSMDHRHVA